ncbi:MAG: hypothetical protein ACYTHJ_19890 [Planctomycetota bacterium]
MKSLIASLRNAEPGRITGAFCYPVPSVALAAALMRRNEVHVFHARQAIMLYFVAMLLSMMAGVAVGVSGCDDLLDPVAHFMGAATLSVSLYGSVNSLVGRHIPLPIIGTWAEKLLGRFIRCRAVA